MSLLFSEHCQYVTNVVSVVWSFVLSLLQGNRRALHIAAGAGSNNVITFLLSYGAGMNDVESLVS